MCPTITLRRSIQVAVVVAVVYSCLGTPCIAEEPEYATVALLFTANGFVGDCLEQPVGVLLDSPLENPSTEILQIAGTLGGGTLVPADAAYISSGGLAPIVWGLTSDLPPANGFMRLGAGSDSTVELCEFVSKSVDTLNPSSPGSASHVLVIVTGRVR